MVDGVWTEMLNVSKKYVNHITNIFATSMTGNPYSNLAPDLRVESTINNDSKLKSKLEEFAEKWKHSVSACKKIQ